VTSALGSGQFKCDNTGRKQISSFGKKDELFKMAGASVHSTAGSQGVRISSTNAGYTTFQCILYLHLYLFSIPEIHQGGYRTRHNNNRRGKK
jgi:hypothetical protein